MTNPAAAGEAGLIERTAREMGIPLKVLKLPEAPALRDLYEADLALIRPDQYVAWRGHDALEGSKALARAAGR